MVVCFFGSDANEWHAFQCSLAGKELGGKGSEDSKTLKDAHILVSRNPTPSARDTKDPWYARLLEFAHDLLHSFDVPQVQLI